MATHTNGVQQDKVVHGLIEEKLRGLSLDQRLTLEEEDDPQVLLSKLLLQLDALQGNNASEDLVVLETDSLLAPEEVISIRSDLNNDASDEIIKELKKVQRQNIVTHCLLSAILVVTLVCQVSEMALISKVRRGINNPVKALGGFIMGMVVRPRNVVNKDKEADESHSLPKIKVELPRVDIPKFGNED